MTAKLKTRHQHARVGEPHPCRLKLRHAINHHSPRKDRRRSNDHVTRRNISNKLATRKPRFDSPRKYANADGVPTENSLKSPILEEQESDFNDFEGGCNSDTGSVAKVSSSPEKISHQNATEAACGTDLICKEEEEKPYDVNSFEDDERHGKAWSVLNKGPERVEISKSDEEDMIRLSQSSVLEERESEESQSDIDLSPTKRKKKQKNRVVKRPRASKARRSLSRDIFDLVHLTAPAAEELQTVQQLTKDSERVRLPLRQICDRDDKEVPSPEQQKRIENARKRAVAMAEEGGAENQDHSSHDTPGKLLPSETPKNVVITVHCLDVPEYERSKNEGDQHEGSERDVRAAACSDSQASSEGNASPREKETLRRRDSVDETERDRLKERVLLNMHDQRYANACESDALHQDGGMRSPSKPKTPGALFSGSGMSTDIGDSRRRRSKKSRNQNQRRHELVGEASPVHKVVTPAGEDGYKISKEGMDISRLLRRKLLSSMISNRDDLADSKEPRSGPEASDGEDPSCNSSLRPEADEYTDRRQQRITANSNRRPKDVNSLACEGVPAKREASKVLRDDKRSSDCSERQPQDVKDIFPPSETNRTTESEGHDSAEMEEKEAGSPLKGKVNEKRTRRRRNKKAQVQEQNLTDNKLPSKEGKVKRKGFKIMDQVLAKKRSESSGSLKAFHRQKRQKGNAKGVSASRRQLSDSKGKEYADLDGNAGASYELRRVSTRPQAACEIEMRPETKTPNLRSERNPTRRFTVERTTARLSSGTNEDEYAEKGSLMLSGKRQRSSIDAANHVLGHCRRATNDGVTSTWEPSSKRSLLHNSDSASLEIVQDVQQFDVKGPSGEQESEQPEDNSSRDEEETREILPPQLQCTPSQEQKKSLKSHVTSRSVSTVTRKSESTKGPAITLVPLGGSEEGLGQSPITPVDIQDDKEEDKFSVEVEEMPKCDRTPNDNAEEMEVVTVGGKRSNRNPGSDPHAPNELENRPTFVKPAPGASSGRRLTRAKELAMKTKKHDLDCANGAKLSTEQNLEDLVDPEKLEEQSKLLTRRSNRSRRSRVGGARRDRSIKALDELSDNDDAKHETLVVPAASSSGQQQSLAKRTPRVQPQNVHRMKTRGRGRMSSAALHEPLAIIDLTDTGDDENTVAETRGTEDDDDIAESLKELQRLSIEDKAKGIKERPHCKYLTPLSDEESQLAEDLTTRTKRDTIVVAIAEAGITLRGESFKRLRGTRWLDDEILNAYVSLINSRNNAVFEEMDEEHRKGIPRTYVFNTYFFTRLCSGPSGFDYPGVKGWTKRAKVDILKRDIILIPINLGNHHWVLSGVDMKHKEVMYLDSMHGPDRVGAMSKLKQWVFEELCDKHGEDIAEQLDPVSWRERKHCYRIRRVGVLPAKLESRDGRPGRMVKVPRQTDGGSCGVFTAKMADCLSLGIKVYFKQNDIRLIRRRMALDLFHGYVPL